jgi:hypothetical protein
MLRRKRRSVIRSEIRFIEDWMDGSPSRQKLELVSRSANFLDDFEGAKAFVIQLL